MCLTGQLVWTIDWLKGHYFIHNDWKVQCTNIHFLYQPLLHKANTVLPAWCITPFIRPFSMNYWLSERALLHSYRPERHFNCMCRKGFKQIQQPFLYQRMFHSTSRPWTSFLKGHSNVSLVKDTSSGKTLHRAPQQKQKAPLQLLGCLELFQGLHFIYQFYTKPINWQFKYPQFTYLFK